MDARFRAYAEAVQKPYSDNWPDRAAMGKMTTPERIDQMLAWHQRMDQEMKNRGEATKAFYAILNSDQKKVFDAKAMRMIPAGHEGRMPRHPR